MKLLFASANVNKANEIQSMLPDGFDMLTLSDISLSEDIPETSPTIEGNAIQKANYITEHFDIDCFADDTGLEVTALNMEPGVLSARYAGPERNDQKNINRVLEGLENASDRSAQFKTIIALNLSGKQHLFEGIVTGNIRREMTGTNGFGYDPIFEPENCGKTFAEMSMDEKNRYSHRARALAKMMDFLKTIS